MNTVRSSVVPISLALSLLILPCGTAKGRENDKSRARTTVQQATVTRVTLKIPIIDGKDVKFVRLSTTEGLWQTKVSQIAQDDQGFMWFGTQYGLSRYDGYTFKVFVHDPTNPDSLKGVFVSALFKDRNGALWVGCEQSLNKLEPSSEMFTQYPIPLVTHISQDTAGMLWLATRGSGLYRLDPGTGRMHQYVHDPSDASSLSSNEIFSSGEDRTGKFWVSNARGLDQFDREKGVVTLHIRADEGSELSFYEDQRGVFWIRDTDHAVLAVLDRSTNRLTHYSFEEPERSGTAFTGVATIVEDQDGSLWLATHGAGLLKFDRGHQRFIRYRNDPGDLASLPQNNVDTLLADHEGNMWAALGRMGVVHFATKPLPFKKLPPDPNNANRKVEKFVGALYVDRQGILWVGTPDALSRIDLKDGRYTFYHLMDKPASNIDVISIAEDHSGALWIGTYKHGLLQLDRRTSRFKVYRHDPADPYSLSNDVVTRMLVDHNGTFWVATADGLNRFDPATGQFTVYKRDPKKRTQSYLDVAEDREGTLWLGTDSTGLHRFDPATGRFTVYEHDVNRLDSLSNNRVNSVHFDRSGTMWVGTQEGLDKFDQNTGAFTVYLRPGGLSGNAVSCVLEDQQGDLWMSTNNGVARFDPKDHSFKSYSTSDGLPGPDLTGWGACSESAAGEMFFGGFSGATVFFPEKVTSSYVPRVVLTDFRLFGIAVAPKRGSALKKPINYTDAITLAHGQNIFSVGFSALSYFNAATNRYRYRLEGLDQRWNEVGSDQRVASYTTLPAGIYTLRVQAATSGGTWSEPGAQLRIEVLPAWWKTRWFRLLCVAALLALLCGLYQLRLVELEREYNMRLEERVSERTRIARELHDTLLQNLHGLMFQFQAARNMFHTRPQEAVKTLDSAIVRTERVITQSQNAIQDFRLEPAAQTDFAELVTAMGNDLEVSQNADGTSPGFRVIVEGGRQTLLPLIQNEVYRIAREVLRNAFRHARAHRIEAEIRYDTGEFRLRIRDDGKGIAPRVLEEGKQAGHWGLPGVCERAQRIGAKLDLWSEPGAGTEVQLSIPAALAYETSRNKSGFRLFRRSHEHRS